MKLVIDIPDYVVEKEMYICYFKAWGETLESTFDKAEPLSEILNKISAEIKERIDKVPMTSFREDGLRDALEVVEKYKKEGAE